MNRALLFASLAAVTCAGCNCTQNPVTPPDGGTINAGGGVGALGGGTATGGGSAAGGGTATGGGSALGGGGGGNVDAGATDDDAGVVMDGGVTTDAGITLDGGLGCVFTPAPANGTRRIVVSHPFPPDGGSRDNRYEVFEVSSTGAVNATGVEFRMGRSGDYSSPIVFSPDGRIGFVAQEQGTIGVFRFEETGVTVVHAAFATGFSPGKLTFLAATGQVLATDFNTQNNGGGLYTIDVACDGTLSTVRHVAPGNSASAELVIPTSRFALVASRSLLNSPMMQDLHIINLTQPTMPTLVTSTTGFPDRDAIPSSIALSPDQRLVALSDNGIFSANRIAFFELSGTTLTSLGLANTQHPAGVQFSPFTNSALVVNTDSADHYRLLTWTTNPLGGFTVSAPLAYAHGRPQLPTVPLMIDRGNLEGRVFIGELDAIRQLQFERDGGITDVASTPVSGTGNAQIVGTIGITP